MIKRSPSRRMVSGSSNPSSPGSTVNAGGSPGMSFTVPQLGRARRPMTSAEIMRQQMRVTEQSDNRLRKTLMRTLVGQMGRRAETIILPLELLRHLKPSEFNDSHEYHLWQKRQLKILEAGLLLHPSIPLEKPNTFATRLRDIIRAGESKPIDTGKNSDTMRTLCNSVVSLSWRSPNGSTPTDVCHWADGFPVNVHVYVALLQSIFDVRDETLVLDEVDELLELMKKTWSTLGITRQIHNVCFTWVLFHQYVATAMVEQDLLYASHTMLAEVASDAKKLDRDVVWAKILSSVLGSILGWAEKRMLRYHDYFLKGNVSQIENLLPLALSASRILGEDFTITEGGSGSKGKDKRDMTVVVVDSSRDRVDHYIRSSVKNAFAKIIEHANSKEVKEEEASEALLQLAKETEELALKEREGFSPILKRWHSTAVGVAAVTLHSCYGAVLKQYLSGVSTLSCETVGVLQRAGKLEKMLVQMVVEDSVDCDDGGKSIVREMVPYEVDYVILNLLKKWIHEKLAKGHECLTRAKETETWNPKSKSEPYAQSAVELTRLAKETVEEFFEIPIGITEDLVQDLADGLENLFQDYTTFVASCVFYESLYVDDVANARIRPALRTLKQNLTLMSAMLTDRAQALAMREVMKASFEAFLMVLLAGGSSRVFLRSDQEMIEEDFESLKRVFCTSGGGEGLITEGVVEREAETVEGVIGLMGQCTEQLMEDFSIITCETSGIGVVMSSSNNNGSGNTGLVQKLPMPPTTGRWHRSDPNTILRVLCHRNDRTANQFLKRNFQLAKRR
uniref:MHD1 domain-containing protein n=1 Tax=Cannabis sativa TaxID=3483 RepID=A0A803Q4I6_CANSA